MAMLQDALNDLDASTLSVVIQMRLEDSMTLVGSAKGKHREGTINDAEAALEMYTDHLHACQSILGDRGMAGSIALAVYRDGDLISSIQQQDDQIARDRQFAIDLLRSFGEEHQIQHMDISHMPGPRNNKDDDAWSCKEMLDKAAALYNEDSHIQDVLELLSASSELDDMDDTASTVRPESSAWAASRKRKTKQKLGHCVARGETKDFFDVARVPCNHEYCRECLASLFQASMRDESLFPPRCDGQAIPLSQVRFFLPTELAKEFEERSVELGTKDRVYCHDPKCSTFIPKPTSVVERMDGDWLACPRCEKTTCTICKDAAHTGDCPDDTSLQQLVETAGNEQWQRCYECHRFLELEQGCNHMTCPCGAQFCYICGLQWKTCLCVHFEEPLLLARAQQIAQRIPNPQRRLFQPTREMRQQPRSRRPSAVPGAAQSRLVGASSLVSESMWESDFSDRSVWEQDWSEDEVENPAPSPRQSSPPVQAASAEAVSPPQRLHSTPPVGIPTSEGPVTGPSGARDKDEGPGADIVAIMDLLRANHECSHK